MRKILFYFLALLIFMAGCSIDGVKVAEKGESSLKANQSNELKANVIDPDSIAKIACGDSHSFILLYNGDLYATGSTAFGVLGFSKLMDYNEIHQWTRVATNVKDVATHYRHSLIIKYNGDVYATGSNFDGQLGIDIEDYAEIHQWKRITYEGNYTNVACGKLHSMFLKNDGTLYVAGSNSNGQLGLGTNGNFYDSFILSRSNVKKMVCGNYFSLIIDKNNKQVYATGSNTYGQLGLGEDDASTEKLIWKQVTTSGDILDIACGVYYSLYLRENGRVYGCGKNNHYQLGIEGNYDRRSWTYLNIDGVRSVNAGFTTSLAIKTTNNRLYATGDLFNTWTYILWDTYIAGCGYYFILGVKNNNYFYGLGRNESGQLGLGEINYFNEFERIEDYLEE